MARRVQNRNQTARRHDPDAERATLYRAHACAIPVFMTFPAKGVRWSSRQLGSEPDKGDPGRAAVIRSLKPGAQPPSSPPELLLEWPRAAGDRIQ